MPPSVTVIIPTYDRRPVLQEAVESVLAQSFRDFELLVVDDGSTDGTAASLAAYGSRLRVVSQRRRGVAAARNFGVCSSVGRYLAFLDSDDLWRADKLEIQTMFMERTPGVRICQSEEIWIRRGVRVNPKEKHRKPSGDVFRPSLDLCLVSASAVMMRRDLFESVGGFDESLPVCEDYDLWLRIAVDHSIPLIPQPLVIKRGGHADQLSRSTWGLDRFRVRALEKLLRSGLEGERRRWVVETLEKKVKILSQGARKRGRERDALSYEETLARVLQETGNAATKGPRVRDGEGASSANVGPLAGVG